MAITTHPRCVAGVRRPEGQLLQADGAGKFGTRFIARPKVKVEPDERMIAILQHMAAKDVVQQSRESRAQAGRAHSVRSCAADERLMSAAKEGRSVLSSTWLRVAFFSVRMWNGVITP